MLRWHITNAEIDQYRTPARYARAAVLSQGLRMLATGLAKAPHHALAAGRDAAHAAAGALDRHRRRRATVRELQALDDQLLRDVGIKRAEIAQIAARSAHRPSLPERAAIPHPAEASVASPVFAGSRSIPDLLRRAAYGAAKRLPRPVNDNVPGVTRQPASCA